MVPGRQKTLTVASNRSDTADYLLDVHEAASELISVGAFVHWYEKFGTTRFEMEEAVEEMRHVADDYRRVHGHV